jgi:hypothetical protein
MKKSYILFGSVLVLLILAFSYTRSCLSSVEESAKSSTKQPVSRATLDSLENELQTRFNEYRAFVDGRLDSLEHRRTQESLQPTDLPKDSHDRSAARQSSGSDQPDESAERSRKSADVSAKAKPPSPARAETILAAPSEEELAIYQEYLKRRLTLPADLTAYELKVAKNELLIDLGKEHSLTASQVTDLIDRVYEYRRKGTQIDEGN